MEAISDPRDPLSHQWLESLATPSAFKGHGMRGCANAEGVMAKQFRESIGKSRCSMRSARANARTTVCEKERSEREGEGRKQGEGRKLGEGRKQGKKEGRDGQEGTSQ